MTEQQLREKTVNIMRGWIGCKQGDKVHKSIMTHTTAFGRCRSAIG